MAGFSQKVLKNHVLTCTPYKGLKVENAIEKDRLFFEKFRVQDDFKKLSQVEQASILRALNLSYDISRYRDNKEIKEIIQLFEQGKTRDFIVNIWGREKGLSKEMCTTLIARALGILESDMDIKKSETISLHTLRYEEIWELNSNMNLDDLPEDLPEPTKRAIITDKYLVALESLQSKEKLLGMHMRTYKVQLKNYLEKIYKPQPRQTDFKSVSTEDLQFLRQIIRKLRGLDLDESLPTTTENDKGVESISYEVLESEKPIEQVIEFKDVIRVKKSNNKQQTQPKSLNDIKNDIGESNLKKLALKQKLQQLKNKS